MAEIIFITGGCRSGKSAYAQKLAEALAGPRAFVATCPILDDEMRDRIRKHRRARQKRRWRTIEEPVDLPGALRSAKKFKVVLVDCLTLWINNLMYEAEKRGKTISEESVALLCKRLLTACREHPGMIIFVTNEVGMGIVPENPVCRLFCDLAGRCSQIIAQASNRMVLMVCGQPFELKKETEPSHGIPFKGWGAHAARVLKIGGSPIFQRTAVWRAAKRDTRAACAPRTEKP